MLHGSETTVRATVGAAAAAVGVIAFGTLLLSVAVEALRGRTHGVRLVTLADRVLPGASRRTAVGLITAIALVLPGATPAGASPGERGSPAAEPAPDPTRSPSPLREWLTRPVEPDDDRPVAPSTSTTTSTTTPATASTTTTTRARTVPSTVPTTTTSTTTPRPSTITTTPRPPIAEPRETDPPTLPPPVVTVNPSPPQTTVVVRPGDCLWTIAAGRLGPGATNADIDRAWRAIWDANRDRIGADPNLIHPGLMLTVPAPVVP
jgi:hypothetical protein